MPSAVAKPVPTAAEVTLGRYRVLRELGRGAQGTVVLAHDPHLDRQVAIKTLHPRGDSSRLLAEARTIAQLSHPNIVTLHDAFEDGGRHCLVFELVEGATLEKLIATERRLAATRAVTLARQILEGLACAHARNIVHRDIKPANVVLSGDGAARIMDFGLAESAGGQGGGPSGTPLYMAPEAISNGTIGPAADVFSVGMTLYQMLTGETAVQGRTTFEVLHKIANVAFEPPSARNPEVPPALDQIVMRAIAKDPAQRYPTATAMLEALGAYAAPGTAAGGEPVPAADTGGAGGAVDFLLKRMRHAGGFPALSQTIGAINRVTSGQEQSVQALTDVLLKDFALTNRLLRTVNSSGFGQYGGTVSTISRAVMILGFDAVRNLAVSLVLMEHLQNKGQASRLREDVIATLFAGIVTRRTARLAGVRDAEEGFVCGVFHNLGRLLATCYLYEEGVEIARRVEQAGIEEQVASRDVLGVSYEELGAAVARSWNLPPAIVDSMRRPGEGRIAKPETPGRRLQLAASLGDAVAAAASGAPARRAQALAAAVQRYGEALPVDEKALGTLVEESIGEFLADTSKLLGDGSRSRFCQQLRHAGSAEPSGSAPSAGADTMDGVIHHTSTIARAGAVTEGEHNPATVLAAGIQDITNSLVDDFKLSDVLRIILETMYRGMAFTRVLIIMRDARTRMLSARFGYGADVERVIKAVNVPLGKEQDVFSVALAKNVDLLISDVDADNIRARIPDWFRQHVAAGTFVLLPIVLDGRGIGLFYGDREHAGDLVIEPREMNLLRTLRNQAVLALRTRK